MELRSGEVRRKIPGPHVRRCGSLIVSLALVATLSACLPRATSSYHPRDAQLAALPLFFYPSTTPPRAVMFFFGNDNGFWRAHQQLAERLARDDVSVIGFDMKQFFSRLPAETPARDSAFAAAMSTMVPQARAELHAEHVPLLLGGHSL